MKITFNLFDLKRKLELETHRAYTWREIGEACGIHYNTLYNMANNKTARIDLDILAKLLLYFESQGMPLTIADFLVIESPATPAAPKG